MTYSQADITNLVSRTGVGGAPIKKVHWIRFTSVLFDLALNDEMGQFADFPEFLKHIADEVSGRGDALGISSLTAPAKQLWERYQLLENRRKSAS